MPDAFYYTSIYGPYQSVMTLPWGKEIMERSEITYNFYSIEKDVNSALRAQRAAARIRKSKRMIVEVPPDQAERIIGDLLLGFLPTVDARAVIKRGDAGDLIKTAISDGRLDASIPPLFEERLLPFRESPVSGKTILEIAKNPVAITVFLVIATKGSPMAVIVTPVGIVTIHVAITAGQELSTWVRKKLRKWLK